MAAKMQIKRNSLTLAGSPYKAKSKDGVPVCGVWRVA